MAMKRLEVTTTIRGTDLWSTDFDSLEPLDHSAVAGQLPLNGAGELYDCVLSGDLPCILAVGQLSLSLVLDGIPYQVADDW
jgi:hypothetical protein